MKRYYLSVFLLVGMLALIGAMPVLAETTAPAAPTAPVSSIIILKGTIIDNMCAQGHQDTIAEFVKDHPKTCMLKEGCTKSGFSIFADGKLSKFSADSGAKIAEFLKKEDSKTTVEVTAQLVNKELNLVSIKNQ